MRHFHLKQNVEHCPAINVDRLWTLVTEQHRKAYEDKTDKAVVIDALAAVSFPNPFYAGRGGIGGKMRNPHLLILVFFFL